MVLTEFLMGTRKVSRLSLPLSPLSGLLDLACMEKVNSEMGSSRPSSRGCRMMEVDT